MKDKIIKLYEKMKSTKVHLWSHLLALIGWFCIFFTILFYFVGELPLGAAYIITLSLAIIFTGIPFLFLLLIEFFTYKHFQIQSKFLLKNKFYNIIWLIGQTFIIVSIILVILTQIDKFVNLHIYPIWCKFLSSIFFG